MGWNPFGRGRARLTPLMGVGISWPGTQERSAGSISPIRSRRTLKSCTSFSPNSATPDRRWEARTVACLPYPTALAQNRFRPLSGHGKRFAGTSEATGSGQAPCTRRPGCRARLACTGARLRAASCAAARAVDAAWGFLSWFQCASRRFGRGRGDDSSSRCSG